MRQASSTSRGGVGRSVDLDHGLFDRHLLEAFLLESVEGGGLHAAHGLESIA